MSLLFGPEEFPTLTGSFTTVQSNYGSATVVLDTSTKVSGANSAYFASTGSGSSSAIKDLGSGYSELYCQLKGFIPTAFAFGVSGYLGFIQAVTSADAAVFTMNVEDYGTVRLTGNNPSSGYKDTLVNIPKNSVFTIEVRLKVSATVGNISVWLNNSTEGSPNYNSGNINTGTTNFQKLAHGFTYTPDSFATGYYLDFVSIDTAFIGTRSSAVANTSNFFQFL